MASLYVGTSGWAYPTWKPAFYPEKLAQKKFLNFYASQLNAVEVNYTFRQLVKETTVQNWIVDTPDHFRFTIKAHQVLTHIKRLKNAEEFMQRFLLTLEGLERAQRLGPVLFQLPPNFKASYFEDSQGVGNGQFLDVKRVWTFNRRLAPVWDPVQKKPC